MTDTGLRPALSEFLKTRRARLSPAEVGLPARGGRRVQGLRREEVAALAGVGLTWYTWLEQGRPIQVSAPFLEHLSRALRLDEAEREHLFVLTQGRPPPKQAAQCATSPALEKVQQLLDAIGCPAYARDSRFNVLAWNAANTQTFGDFAAIPPSERNILRLMFLRPDHRRNMLNWEQDARSLVAKFRVNYGQASDTAEFSRLVQELSAASDEFRRIWSDHDVANLGEGVYLYRTRKRGIVAFQHSTLAPEVAPDLRLVLYLRVDEEPAQQN